MPNKKPTAKYAQGTEVSIEKSQSEIRVLLQKHGVVSGFMAGEYNGIARLAFEMHSRRIMFQMPVPRISDKEVQFMNAGARGQTKRTEAQAWDYVTKETRRRWRALALCIKAKLESVATGIETFEDAFMPQTVLPTGETIGDWMRRDENQKALHGGTDLPLLPGPKGR